MLRVGLTGGIASGKSRVAERFEALGAPVIDADRAARAVVEPGSRGLTEVVAAFGEGVLTRDGALDRQALRQRIFADDGARQRLEAILHPLIREHMTAAFRRVGAAGHAYAVGVVPLLVETGQAGAYDRVLVVDVPADVQRGRLCDREGIPLAEADAMIASQAGRWERLRHAHDVVTNAAPDASRGVVACQVDALDRKYRLLGTSPAAGA